MLSFPIFPATKINNCVLLPSPSVYIFAARRTVPTVPVPTPATLFSPWKVNPLVPGKSCRLQLKSGPVATQTCLKSFFTLSLSISFSVFTHRHEALPADKKIDACRQRLWAYQFLIYLISLSLLLLTLVCVNWLMKPKVTISSGGLQQSRFVSLSWPDEDGNSIWRTRELEITRILTNQ